jgi:hypothetical protein
MAGRWSVTLDGPEERLRGLSFVAEGPRLVDAIREAVGGNGAVAGNGANGATHAGAHAGAPGSASPSPPEGEARDRHDCERCGKTVVVVYERRPNEPKSLAAVACPHCWNVGRVEVGAWAAAGGEYRAEKG